MADVRPLPVSGRRARALVQTLAMAATLAVAFLALFALRDEVPLPVLFAIALAGGIPATIAIQRGWTRYLWADRIERARRRAEAAPGDAEAAYELGVLCSMHGAVDEARAAFERARSAKPGHAPSTVGLGHLLAQQEDLDGALELFVEAAATDPGLFSAHYAIGGVHRRREQYARAIQAYDRALKIDADDAYTLAELARCYAGLGDGERAGSYLARAAEHGVRDRELERELAAPEEDP
jgi:tetratricopeptide (TPR) repeat protein